MKYVLDASIAVKWSIPEPDSAKALTLQDDVRRLVHEIIAPDTFPVEIAHSLTKAERRGLLHPGEAALKLADTLLLGPKEVKLPNLECQGLSKPKSPGYNSCL